jgi:hypothetical protein
MIYELSKDELIGIHIFNEPIDISGGWECKPRERKTFVLIKRGLKLNGKVVSIKSAWDDGSIVSFGCVKVKKSDYDKYELPDEHQAYVICGEITTTYSEPDSKKIKIENVVYLDELESDDVDVVTIGGVRYTPDYDKVCT